MATHSYTTTFGIDVTKKCFGSTGTKRSWAMGSISEDCLKNISVTYEEKFGAPYAGQVRDAYEEVLGGVVKTIKKSVKVVQALANGEAVTNAISESGGTGSDKQSLQSLLLEYGTAVAAAETASGNGSASGNKLAELIGKSISIPAYNIPTRAEIPGLSLGFGNSVKINFQFGSAGLFNAKEEVYDPIKTIMQDFQNFSVQGNRVTAKSGGIPWEVGGLMAKAEMLGKLNSVDPKITSMASTVKTLASATTKFGKAASKVIEAKVGLDALYDKVESTDAGSFVKDEYLDSNDDGVKFLGMEFFNSSHIKEDSLASMSTAHYKDNGDGSIQWNDSSYSNYVKRGIKTQVIDLANKGREGEKELKQNPQVSVWSSLAKLAEAEPKAIAKVIEDRYGLITQMSIYLGCYNKKGQNIYYSVDDIVDDWTNGTILSAVRLSGIPEKVEAGLDYTNVDQNGYPKSGWIAIKKMHIVDPFGSFKATFSHV